MSTLALVLGIIAIFCGLLMAMLAARGLHARSGISRSLAAVDALGTAARPEAESLEPSFRARVVTPILANSVTLGHKLTPADNAAHIRHQLDVAGNPTSWTVDRVVSLKVIGFAAALMISLFVTASFGFTARLVVCVGAALVGWVGVNLWLRQKGEQRTAQMRKDLPDAIDLLTISVEAGLGFDAAISQVARNTNGPVAGEFARLLQEMQIGMARGEAMRAMGDRSSLEELSGFANAMVQADAFGIPVGKVLRVQSHEMRVKRRQRAEEKAQKVAVKVLFPLMFCILPILFIVVLGPVIVNFISR